MTMMKFNRETLDGSFFGKTGMIEMPLFRFVDTKYAKSVGSRQYQIDVYGQERGEERIWICECKYTRSKLQIAQVERLEQAGQALKQEARDAGRAVLEIRMWLVSTGGFNREVLDHVEDREDIYISDHDGINGIFQAYGGNYHIPVFHES